MTTTVKPFRERVADDIAKAKKALAATEAFILSVEFAALEPRSQAKMKKSVPALREHIATQTRHLTQPI